MEEILVGALPILREAICLCPVDQRRDIAGIGLDYVIVEAVSLGVKFLRTKGIGQFVRGGHQIGDNAQQFLSISTSGKARGVPGLST